MTINYDQLSEINKTLASFPNAKLQIVTKNRDFKLVKELIDKGYHLFGENKVQEAQDKFKNIIDPNLELHLIGPLQTNKAKVALLLFDCIQSIDRAKLVNEISKYRTKIAFKTKLKILRNQNEIGFRALVSVGAAAPTDFQKD